MEVKFLGFIRIKEKEWGKKKRKKILWGFYPNKLFIVKADVII